MTPTTLLTCFITNSMFNLNGSMNQTWLNVSVAIATKNIRHVPSNLSPTNETKMSRSSSADWYLTPESLQHGCLTTRPLPADLFAQRSYTALRKHPADKWMLPREVQQAVAFTHTGGGGGGGFCSPSFVSWRLIWVCCLHICRHSKTSRTRLKTSSQVQRPTPSPSTMNAASSFHLAGRGRKKNLFYCT